jgi:AcrR family transcriptional regulator
MTQIRNRRFDRSASGRKVRPNAHGDRQRTRLSPIERQEQIVQAAIRFFADYGFSGSARDLAARIGIVHGLLYRYFPTKEALIERVYQEIFEGRWNPEWITTLKDRSRPLRERLIEVYVQYAHVIHTYEWSRMFQLAGIAGLDVNKRYRAFLRKEFIPLVISETRFALGLSGNGARELSDAEEDLMYFLHGGILYIGVRKWVYRLTIPKDVTPNIVRLVDVFLAGARELLMRQSALHNDPSKARGDS